MSERVDDEMLELFDREYWDCAGALSRRERNRAALEVVLAARDACIREEALRAVRVLAAELIADDDLTSWHNHTARFTAEQFIAAIEEAK